MVLRRGYYVLNNYMTYTDVQIAWDLGFTREAKLIYVQRLHDALTGKLGKRLYLEVTSASNMEIGRQLSPLFAHFQSGLNFEDAFSKIRYDDVYHFEHFTYPLYMKHEAFLHFYCYYGRYLLPAVRLFEVFTDVFYNPSKEGWTQAEACALLKLLDMQGNLDVLEDLPKFLGWYNTSRRYKNDTL